MPNPVPIPDPTSAEPALSVGVITAAVGAVLGLVVGYWRPAR